MLDDKNFDFDTYPIIEQSMLWRFCALLPISKPRNPLRKLLIIVLWNNVDIKVIKFGSKVLLFSTSI